MKNLILAIFLIAASARGQLLAGVFGGVINPVAAQPTFSPAAGVVGTGTTVTASTTSSPCSSYIYIGTTSPPTTNSSTIVISSAETIHAYVHNCPGYQDSGIASAAYTLGIVFVAESTAPSAQTTSLTLSYDCTAGDLLVINAYATGVATTFSFTGTVETRITSSTSQGTNSTFYAQQFYEANCTGGTGNIILGSTGAGNYITFNVLEYAGASKTSPLDTGITNSSSGQSYTWSGTITAANAGELLVMGGTASPAAWSALTSGWTGRVTTSGKAYAADKTSSASGSNAVSVSNADNAANVVIIGAFHL